MSVEVGMAIPHNGAAQMDFEPDKDATNRPMYSRVLQTRWRYHHPGASFLRTEKRERWQEGNARTARGPEKLNVIPVKIDRIPVLMDLIHPGLRTILKMAGHFVTNAKIHTV